jgi:hypothetical protein
MLLVFPKSLELHLEHLDLLSQVIILMMVHLLQLVDHLVHLPTKRYRVILFPEVHQNFLDLVLIKLTHRVIAPVLGILLL